MSKLEQTILRELLVWTKPYNAMDKSYAIRRAYRSLEKRGYIKPISNQRWYITGDGVAATK